MNIPVVDLADFLSGDPQLKTKFCIPIRQGLRRRWFCCSKEPWRLRFNDRKPIQVHGTVFPLPYETKKKYELPELSGQRGILPSGVNMRKVRGPDLKEFFQLGQSVEDNDPVKEQYPDNVTVEEIPGLHLQ